MQTVILIFNFITYFLVYKFIFKKYGFGPTSLIVLFYCFFALTAVLLYGTGVYEDVRREQNMKLNEPSIFPFLYMIGILAILFSPIYKNPIEQVTQIKGPIKLNINVFLFVYIVVALATVILLVPSLSNISASYTIDAAGEEFMDRSQGNSRFSPLQIQFINYTAVFNMIGIPLFFYYLAFKSKEKLMLIILGVCAFMPSFLQAIINLSRGAMFFWLLNLVIGYALFRKFLPKRIRIILKTFSFIALPILIVSSLIITYSRFGEGDDAFLSVFTYFGESFLNFPLLFWGHYTGCSMGLYHFEEVSQLFLDTNVPNSKIARFAYFQEMTGIPVVFFRTIVGSIVMEFGYLGAILFSWIWSKVFSKLMTFKNGIIPFNRMIVYYYFYTLIAQGIWGFNTNFTQVYSIFILFFLLSCDFKSKKIVF